MQKISAHLFIMFFNLYWSDLQQIKSSTARLQKKNQCEFADLSRKKKPGHWRKIKPLPIIEITVSAKSISQEKISLSNYMNTFFCWQDQWVLIFSSMIIILYWSPSKYLMKILHDGSAHDLCKISPLNIYVYCLCFKYIKSWQY